MKREGMIGLQKGMVQVVAYQTDWPALFIRERDVLCQDLGNLVLNIQHVGSTAVPGLAAKPILDIAVAVAAVEVIPQCRQPLCSLGYIDRGDAGKDGGYLFVKESTPNLRTHHLHVVTKDDPQWGNYLRFRELLREHEAPRTAYATLKQSLQMRFVHDRKAYTAAKEAFICAVLRKMGKEAEIK
jgi:GrpB-like predicted nucleotidyltransferase (UPF0157 family)